MVSDVFVSCGRLQGFQQKEFDMKSGFRILAEGCVFQLTCRSTLGKAVVATHLRWLPLLLLCAVIIGCAGLQTSYEGTPASPDNRYPLATREGGPAAWQAKDMALYYESFVKNGALEIKGTVERLNTIKNFSVINYFRVSVYFLNADGIILGNHLLWSAGSRVDETFVRWTFEKQFPLPEGATAVGFSYRGGFSDGGGGDSGSAQTGWEVWARP
jgi:hypothetical protein